MRFDWTRLRLTLGTIVYVARVNSIAAFNVWKPGAYWRWVLVTTAELSETDRVVLAWGEAPTMTEAKLRAEQWAAQANVLPPQQGLFPAREEKPNDLPF